jgi:hypothetical protein
MQRFEGANSPAQLSLATWTEAAHYVSESISSNTGSMVCLLLTSQRPTSIARPPTPASGMVWFGFGDPRASRCLLARGASYRRE